MAKNVQVRIEKLIIIQRPPRDDDGTSRKQHRFPSLISSESSIIEAIEDAIQEELIDQAAAKAPAMPSIDVLERGDVEAKRHLTEVRYRNRTTIFLYKHRAGRHVHEIAL